jgi:phasin family protein
MTTVNEQVSNFQNGAFDAAVKFARMSLDGAERLIAINLEATKTSIDESAGNLKAISAVKDVQGLNTVRTKVAENSLGYATAYSRTVYELASNAQAEYTSLVEQGVADFQKTLADGLDKVAKNAPAGSEVAVAALKSNLAASNAAFDSVTKALKQAASYTDANFKAAAKTIPAVSGKRK